MLILGVGGFGDLGMKVGIEEIEVEEMKTMGGIHRMYARWECKRR